MANRIGFDNSVGLCFWFCFFLSYLLVVTFLIEIEALSVVVLSRKQTRIKVNKDKRVASLAYLT